MQLIEMEHAGEIGRLRSYGPICQDVEEKSRERN
jgi:hypothetical protein